MHVKSTDVRQRYRVPDVKRVWSKSFVNQTQHVQPAIRDITRKGRVVWRTDASRRLQVPDVKLVWMRN